MMDTDLFNMIVANAPAVAVLMWLSYRLEKQLSSCVAKQGELLDRLLTMWPENNETTDTR
jgi:hypothetical protein